MANVDESVRRAPHWWESPPLLGGLVLGLGAVLTIVFW
jgi:hypothetical protein